eukprot:1191138-Prorocentrum_minimum.AAC.2
MFRCIIIKPRLSSSAVSSVSLGGLVDNTEWYFPWKRQVNRLSGHDLATTFDVITPCQLLRLNTETRRYAALTFATCQAQGKGKGAPKRYGRGTSVQTTTHLPLVFNIEFIWSQRVLSRLSMSCRRSDSWSDLKRQRKDVTVSALAVPQTSSMVMLNLPTFFLRT